MFLTNQGVSDVIAHFIGYFELQVEAGRLRWDYDPFPAEKPLPPAQPELPVAAHAFTPTLEISAYVPAVHYAPPSWTIDQDPSLHLIKVNPTFIHLNHPNGGNAEMHLPKPAHGGSDGPAPPVPQVGEEPGAVVIDTHQTLLLADNDLVVLGTPDVAVVFQPMDGRAFDGLVNDALAVSAPITDHGAPASINDIPAFMDDMAVAFHQVAETQTAIAGETSAGATETVSVHVAEGPTLAGTFINGEMSSEPAPVLEDSLPAALQTEIEAPAAPEVTSQTTTITPDDVSISVEAGANLMVNEATVINAGLTTTILAVLGDYHQTDAIIQTNAYSDVDAVTPNLAAIAGDAASTTAQNIATFEHQTSSVQDDTATANPEVFPTNWQVCTVSGDLTFASWTTQISFALDNDMHVLTTTGTTTTITTGGNETFNTLDFSELGRLFDLIVVGGSYYDGNFISQTNVLYDNDTVAANGGDVGDGVINTGGNLLWNEACIVNVGAATITMGVPDTYALVAQGLANHDLTMPDGLGTDSNFQGLSMLKVLFIAGNLYDLNYIQQVNVLGDADQVAIAQKQLLDATPAVNWDISTGDNALVNTATIIDYDTLGKAAYVGGQVYSQAMLIQSDLVADGSHAGLPTTTADGGALVNEAIAFLDHDGDAPLAAPADDDSNNTMHIHVDAPSLDVMHSVLA
ncbi:MAG TPA: hypothetical protein VGM83_21415 [Devosiaceae bacterium]